MIKHSFAQEPEAIKLFEGVEKFSQFKKLSRSLLKNSPIVATTNYYLGEINMPKTKTGIIYRSAKTGKFVTKKYSDKHKSTTVKETIKPAKTSKSTKKK
jgi:hypothetical protein